MIFLWGGGHRSTFLVVTVGLCSRLAAVLTVGIQRPEKNPESVSAAPTSCSFLDVDGLFGPVPPSPPPLYQATKGLDLVRRSSHVACNKVFSRVSVVNT